MPSQKVGMKARTATKVQEGELIRNAKRLRDDPDLLLPKCAASCRSCPFERIGGKLRRLTRWRDDEKKLKASSRWGGNFSKAFAGTLLLAIQEKAPYLAVARVGNREVAYASRGKARKETLVGFQHFDDPNLRLLPFAKLARRYGLHIYSTKKGMICTGREDKPPKEYVSQVLNLLLYGLEKEDGVYTCPHLEGRAFLRVEWPAASLSLSICRYCVSSKENIPSTLSRRMTFPRTARPFRVEVHPNYVHKVPSKSCPLNAKVELSRSLSEEYLSGGISDKEVLTRHIEEVVDGVRSGPRRIYAFGNQCFDDNLDLFIDALRPTNAERLGLKAVLEHVDESLILDEATPSKVLEMFWDEYGDLALEAVLGEEASGMSKEDLSKEMLLSRVLREAEKKARSREILSTLPKYRELPPVARFCDSLARLFKTKGPKVAADRIMTSRGPRSEFRALEFAFLLAFGFGEGREWQYEKEEVDFGHHLKKYVIELLEADGEDYDRSLKNLLRESGYSFEIGKFG